MSNQPPLNQDALRPAVDAVNELYADGYCPKAEDAAEVAVSAYLAVAQPVVNSFDPRELNRRGWTCGCEPGNYDSCNDCQSACNELAVFLNRPAVNDA